MSRTEACCTCATLLTDTKVPYDAATEKPLVLDRRLDCCGRTICATCQYRNRRFETYCPFCQISTEPSVLPKTGLRLPPAYNSNTATTTSQTPQQSTETSTRTITGGEDLPPAYNTLDHPTSSSTSTSPSDSNSFPSSSPSTSDPPPKDTIHHLSPSDTIHSLSLSYSVPASILRTHNTLFSDSLLPARKTLLIPHTHYRGPPLSTPPDPAEEERKNKVRRWMVSTKCADYAVAELYLKGCGYDLESAVEAYREDEKWESENPMAKGKNSGVRGGRRRGGGMGGLVGQLG